MPKSEGWKADYATFFRYYLRGNYPQIPLVQLRVIYEPVLKYLGTHWEFWAVLKGEDPLQLMSYLASVFKRKTTLALPALANYKKWIKSGSFYHAVILRHEELNHTPHLAFAQVPNMNQRSPNEDALIFPPTGIQGHPPAGGCVPSYLGQGSNELTHFPGDL